MHSWAAAIQYAARHRARQLLLARGTMPWNGAGLDQPQLQEMMCMACLLCPVLLAEAEPCNQPLVRGRAGYSLPCLQWKLHAIA
jgi:hypothetical protein